MVIGFMLLFAVACVVQAVPYIGQGEENRQFFPSGLFALMVRDTREGIER